MQLKGNQGNLQDHALNLSSFEADRNKEFLEKAHGRIEQRTVKVYELNYPFPYAKTLIVVERHREILSKDSESDDEGYYLSSLSHDSHTPEEWLMQIRGHWAGVENRNHWRKDAIWNEDRMIIRNPVICANLGILRNACFLALEKYEKLPNLERLKQICGNRPNIAWKIIKGEKTSFFQGFK